MKLQMKPTQARLQAEAISSHPDFDRGPRKAVLILVATTALFFVLLFAWMSFAALDADDNWRPLIDPPVFTERTLPAGLAWAGLRLDGQAEASAAPRLQFGTQAPEYELRVATPGGNARFTGKASGEVILSLPGQSAP